MTIIHDRSRAWQGAPRSNYAKIQVTTSAQRPAAQAFAGQNRGHKRAFAPARTSDDLRAEHLEHEGLNQYLIDWLVERGVPPLALASPWPIAATRVQFRRDGTFDRDPDGVTAFTIAVIDHGDIIDLAAWHPGTDRLGTWLGFGFALGQAQIHAAVSYAFDSALKVHLSPLEWLRAGRRGIVILKPAEAHLWLRDVSHIEVVDEEHARALRRMIQPPKPLVRIVHGDQRASA